MIVRIVKMQFKSQHIETFKGLFSANHPRIESFEGCTKVDLLQDVSNPAIFFTYSHWVDVDALNRYRHSELFTGIWTQTKRLFDAAPEAWSVKSI
jgi:quinol monooxygenase YgiN